MEEERKSMAVVGLIEKATNSIEPNIDPRLLKSIKSLVRYSDLELRIAAQTLTNLMKRNHSQVRYLALLIIDELFMRSKLFRTLLVENLDQLLSLSVGFRRNLPLPAPPAVASLLRSKAIEFLEKWNNTFGVHYRQLRLGYDYLKNTLRFQFPNLQANAARMQQQRSERERKTKEILLNKFELLKENFPTIKDEILSTIDEIGECLDIIRSEDEDMSLAPIDDEEMEEFCNSELRQIRLDSLKEGEKVHENSENEVVFDALRESYKLLVTKHLVTVQEWISVLIRVETSENRFRDSMLKEIIDIRNCVQSVKRKCEESGCILPNTQKQEEDDCWEEGQVEANGNGRTSPLSKISEDTYIASTSQEKIEYAGCDNRGSNGNDKPNHEGNKTDVDPLKSKLLAEAPVMNYGSFLDNWGSNRDFMAHQRGLELESHWGRVDYDQVIPAAKIAELNVQTTLYNEEPVAIQECRAPLRKGGLCRRRDQRVCPFHGPIVCRDDEGKPIYQTSSVETTALDLGKDVVEQLAQQAVSNVRKKDQEEAKKKEHDKKSLKRARLANVREHNNAVLRDAALASTSGSQHFGEDMETTGGRSSTGNKKQTLASMLKKKVTAKDRLSQRLLNTRVRDSTTKQLTLGEDAKYREAFPNQW